MPLSEACEGVERSMTRSQNNPPKPVTPKNRQRPNFGKDRVREGTFCS